MKRSLADLIISGNSRKYSIEDTFIIAEAGVNHEGSLDNALHLVDAAFEGGAHAIKFQSYKAEKLASRNSPAYWDLDKEPTRSQYELFKKYDTLQDEDYLKIYEHCNSLGIEFVSTPFDLDSAKFLEPLNGVIKVSSSDLNNKPFIDYLCRMGKPMLISTGASYMWEVEENVSWLERNDISYGLLHCVLSYPTREEDADLERIRLLEQKFPGVVIGYSDHTMPGDLTVMNMAAVLGARIVEKHFTLDKSRQGNDHYHAMDKNDLKKFVESLNRMKRILGEGKKDPQDCEMASRTNARRSLVAARDIPKDTIVENEDITYKRPGTGMDPRNIDIIIGRKATCDIIKDTIIDWGHFT